MSFSKMGLLLLSAVILFSAILSAQTGSQSTSLKVTEVQGLDCKNTAEALKARLALTKELGKSFQQISDELINVYSIWSRRLGEQSDLKQSKEFAAFFAQNAKALSAGKAQSVNAIESLNRDLELLSDRLLECVKK